MSSQPAGPGPHKSLYFPDGDIFLRSSDEVVFKVHKLILRLASPFFRDMFTVPPSSSEIQTIQMEESGFILGMLLGWIYPQEPRGRHRSIVDSDLQDGLALLDAARKLELKKPLDLVVTILEDILKNEDPLRAWAIATQFRLDAARIDAAKRFIRSPGKLSIPDELKNVNAKEFAELIALKESLIKEIHTRSPNIEVLGLCHRHYNLFFRVLGGVLQDMEPDESLLSHSCINKVVFEWYAKYRKSSCEGPLAALPLERPRSPCGNVPEVALMVERCLEAKVGTLLDRVHCKQVIQLS